MDFIHFLASFVFILLSGEAKGISENADSARPSNRNCKSYSCGQPVIVNSRVVGGEESIAGKFPWQVLFKGLSSSTGRWQTTCGGSVISNQWVVTAAHCTPGKTPETIHVVLGDFDKTQSDGGHDKEFAVAAIYNHPNYDSSTNNNDISLLKLGGSAVYSDYTIPVCLPTQGVNVNAGTVCWVTGWGVTNTATSSTPNLMNEARVPIIEQSVCTAWYSQQGVSIMKQMVCAGFDSGGIDTCQGDSGGPLFCEDSRSSTYYLEGITSFGIGCALSQRPGVYARVSEFRDWIDTTMASNAATETFFGYATTACGSTITTSQIVRLPVDSENQLYENNMNCVWTIVPPTSTVTVKLTFVERFAVEPLASCSYDYLSISTTSGTQIGNAKVCGLTLPSALTSSTGETPITVTFVSDGTSRFEGFAINVEFLDTDIASSPSPTSNNDIVTLLLQTIIGTSTSSGVSTYHSVIGMLIVVALMTSWLNSG